MVTKSLRELPFLSGLDEDALVRLALYVHELTFSPGQMILMEGEPCQRVYFVVRGLVRARRMSLGGREHVLAYVGPGDVVNLIPPLDRGLALVSVEAATEATLYAIPCEQFRELLREHHAVALAVVEHLAADVRRLTDMVEDLALHTVRARLARFLLAQADDPSSSRRWTQQEVSSRIGTVREMVGRTLRTLVDEGLVRRERGRLVITDREGLEREAARE